jgi:hypothetical protein
MTDQGVVVFGIPIPSSSPVFLGIVAVHVAAGLICSVAGIVAMLAPKRSGRHPSAGTVYYWGLVVVFLSTPIFAAGNSLTMDRVRGIRRPLGDCATTE